MWASASPHGTHKPQQWSKTWETRRDSPLGAVLPANLVQLRGRLHLSPDVPEIIKTFLAGEPFGRQHCTFGKASAGLGVVAHIDTVGARFQDYFVKTYHLPFPEGRNFQRLPSATRFTHNLLKGKSGARGSVSFLGVVASEYLSGILVTQGRGRSPRHLKKDVYSD